MIKIEIKSVFGSILFSYEKENNTVKDTVLAAIAASADLSSADLRSADLRSADLSYADLSYANLSYANLSSADLSSADLRSADLSYADLRYADLSYADLRYADLRYADLRYADLRYADLRVIKADLFDVLLRAIPEVPFLKQAITEGKIDGSTYKGECACLSGTLDKKATPEVHNRILSVRDESRPIERFFFGINKGDTPDTSQFSKLALEWVEEFESYLPPQIITPVNESAPPAQ